MRTLFVDSPSLMSSFVHNQYGLLIIGQISFYYQVIFNKVESVKDKGKIGMKIMKIIAIINLFIRK